MNQDPFNKPPIPAPIPSPFELPASTPATPSQTRNQLVIAAFALATGALEWVLAGLVGMWPVALLVLGTFVIIAVGGTLGVARAGKTLGWRVRREDLPLVRRTVDMNMKGAYILMASLWPFLLVALARGEASWALPIMVFSIPFSVWSTGVEKKFKNMEVEPDAVSGYQALLAGWKEARFGLRKEGAG